MSISISRQRDASETKTVTQTRRDGTTFEQAESDVETITIETREDLEQRPQHLTNCWVRDNIGRMYVQYPHLMSPGQQERVRQKHAEFATVCEPDWDALEARLNDLPEALWVQYREKAGIAPEGVRAHQIETYLNRGEP